MLAAICVENVCKKYSKTWRGQAKEALKDVSLSIPVGETFGFIGPNGAGKSTLIKILVGALRPSSGRVALFGGAPLLPAHRQGLGFVPESPSMPEHLTPFEMLLMGLRLHRVRLERQSEADHCNYWLDRFGLLQAANLPIRNFSKGMVQRTALAHALAIQARLLILDEPLSGLDPVGRRDVVDILAEYRRSGNTLFFSSHVLHDVERIADRFALIDQGELRTVRSPLELVEDQSDHYVVRFRAGGAVTRAVEAGHGMYLIDIGGSSLADCIQKVQSEGGIIQDVTPRNSLETVFFRMIEQARRGREC